MSHKDNSTYQAMLEAVQQTLETMAFAEVTEQSAEMQLQMPDDSCWVSILVHDPIQGEIIFALAQPLLTTLTADMFGIEAGQITENQRQDIIAEVLNTLAGLFMTRLLSADQTYQLGLPEHGKGPLPEPEEDSNVWNLQIEGFPLLIIANGSGF